MRFLPRLMRGLLTVDVDDARTCRFRLAGTREPLLVLRYAPGHNFNGSARDIAGVCNAAGNVMGLMPHPEHAVDVLTGSVDGLRLIGAPAGRLTAASAQASPDGERRPA